MRRAEMPRWAAALAAIALLALMVSASRDFGTTHDERFQQRYGEKIWDYVNGDLARAEFDTEFGNEYLYGGLVEFAAAAAQQVVPADVYVVRHGVNSVFGWLGILYAGRLAAHLFGAPAGWLTAILLAVSPRYFADSMNNPKDLPFAALAIVALFYALTIDRRPPYLSWSHAFKLAAAIALAINVRPLGLVLLGFAGFVLTLHVARSLGPGEGASSRRDLARVAARFAVIVLVAIPAGTLFWPWAQAEPFVRPVRAFFIAAGATWAQGFHVLYAGEDFGAGALPWHYVPVWLAISMPPVVLVGLALAPVAWKRFPGARLAIAALAIFALAPVTAAIVRNATIYDGMRHLFFVVPPLVVLAGAGWWATIAAKQGRTGLLLLALLAAGLLEPLLFHLRNHPNQHVYFSPIMGGPRAAFARYDMDYWGHSMLQAIAWADGLATRAQMPVVVSGNPPQNVQADAGRYRTLTFARRDSEAYHLDIRLLRGPRDSVREFADRPDVLYRVTTADGAPLCVVLPGPAFGALYARLNRGG